MIIKEITNSQKEQLLSITPSIADTIEYRPCQVILKSGKTIENVYIQEEKSYVLTWGIMPDTDSGKKYLLIEDVVTITESPNRLQANLANKIYKAGESGMGYCLYKLILDNGQIIDVCAGNAVDFAPLPSGLTFKNVIDVLPGEGSRTKFVNSPEYYWCLFKGDMPKTHSIGK